MLRTPSNDGYNVSGMNNDILRLAETYLDLIADLHVSPGQGIVELYNYRAGVPDYGYIINPYDIKRVMEAPGGDEIKRSLMKFAHGCVCFNVVTLYFTIRDAILIDMNKDNDRVLSTGVVTMLQDYVRTYRNGYNSYNDSQDNIVSLAHACFMEASSHLGNAPSRSTVVDFFKTVDRIIDCVSTEDYRKWHYHLLRVMYGLACCFYRVHPGTLTSTCDTVSNSKLCITDVSLASVPMAPTMLNLCSDSDIPVSRKGALYVSALESALSGMASIRIQKEDYNS